MALSFSSYAKDRFMEPHMSQFTEAEIRDMTSADSSNWISNFVLNSILRANWTDPTRQFVFNFLRRSEAAFQEYELARIATQEFLSGTQQSASGYMKAVFHWEVFLAQAWHGYVLLGRVGNVKKLFEKGSEAIEERLNHLYNQSKHAESVIDSGQLPEYATIPVWLTNKGLQSHDAALSFAEASEILADLAKGANLLQDPLTFAQQVRGGAFSGDDESP